MRQRPGIHGNLPMLVRDSMHTIDAYTTNITIVGQIMTRCTVHPDRDDDAGLALEIAGVFGSDALSSILPLYQDILSMPLDP